MTHREDHRDAAGASLRPQAGEETGEGDDSWEIGLQTKGTVKMEVWKTPKVEGLDRHDVFWGPRGHCHPRWIYKCQQ